MSDEGEQLTPEDLDPNHDPGYPPSFYDQQLMNFLLDIQKDFNSVLDSNLASAKIQGEQIKALNIVGKMLEDLKQKFLNLSDQVDALEAKLNQ